MKNIKAMVADISSLRNVELPAADIALFANVIHGTRNKVELLKGVKQLLKPRGRIVVMNWKVDKNTPRGPPMKLRPSKEDTLEYLRKAGYEAAKVHDVPVERNLQLDRFLCGIQFGALFDTLIMIICRHGKITARTKLVECFDASQPSSR